MSRFFRIRRSAQIDGDANVAGAVNAESLNLTRPVLLPSFTDAQRNALTGVVNGMLIYNTTTNTVQARVNGAWVNVDTTAL